MKFFRLNLCFFRIKVRGERSYDEPPRTQFQRTMRRHSAGVLLDHTSKPLRALETERVKRIPEGGDWRDIPNEEVKLEDGTVIKKLIYSHKNYHYHDDKYGSERGVCSCMEEKGAECMEMFIQKNTLIPWSMPHSGTRNNEFNNMYGKVPKNGMFCTVTAEPHPSKKQGRVLHPDQDRMLSVREFARAQVFPDNYRFCGTLKERYRQVRLSWCNIYPQANHRWEMQCHLPLERQLGSA